MSYLVRLRNGDFSTKTPAVPADKTDKSPSVSFVSSSSGQNLEIIQIPALPVFVYRFRLDGKVVTTHSDESCQYAFLKQMVERFGNNRRIYVLESWPINS